MESLRVKDLREIAKSKGLKGFYKLRKSELISFIKDNESTSSLLDEEIPTNLPTPSLIPTQYVPPKITKSKKKITRRDLTDWERWLIESASEPTRENMSETKKKILDAYDQKPQISEPQLISSALGRNAQRWFISGEGYKIPKAFLNETEDGVRKVVDIASQRQRKRTHR